MDRGTRASAGTRASSPVSLDPSPDAECFIVCASVSPCIPCVPQITVLKIPLIVSGPELAAELSICGGWKKRETGKKE